jgi:hypothetical protein
VRGCEGERRTGRWMVTNGAGWGIRGGSRWRMRQESSRGRRRAGTYRSPPATETRR